jgi:hypothetical protein
MPYCYIHVKICISYCIASIAYFDELTLYADADFGKALRSSGFTLQAALPNLKRLLKKK